MRTLTVLTLCAAVAACGKKPESPKPGGPRSTIGRAETQPIRNTESIGYAGNAIADKVDGALDANEQRKDSLDAAVDAQSNPK